MSELLSATATLGEAMTANITVDAADELARNLPYAKYMVFGGDGFEEARESSLLRINADITRGTPVADYAATLDDDRFDGKAVSYIGLSADGEKLVCRADFAPVTKECGVPLVAKISVFLSIGDSSDKVFAGGDDPLVRFLLGAFPIGGNVYAAAGFTDAPNGYLSADFPHGDPAAATILFGSDGLKIETQVDAAAKDAIIFMDGKPALRANLRENARSETLIIPSATVFGDLCADIAYEYAQSVMYCSCGSTNHPDAMLVRAPERATKLKNALGFSVGKGAEIKTDETGEFAAIGGDGEIMLISGAGGLPKREFSVPRDRGDDFAVCRGGYLVRIGEKITVFDLSGGATEYDLPGGEKNAVVRDGNYFHFARLSGSAVERFLLSSGTVSALPSLSVGADAKLFCSLFRIGVASSDGCRLFNRSAGVGTEFDFFRLPRLEELVSRAGGAENIEIRGELAVLKENGSTVVACVRDDSEFTLPSGAEAVPFGDWVVYDGGVMLFDRGKRKLRSVSGFCGGDIVAAGRVGDHLITVDKDGFGAAHYLSGGKTFLYCPTATAGDELRVGIRVKKDPLAGKEKAKVTVKLNW